MLTNSLFQKNIIYPLIAKYGVYEYKKVSYSTEKADLLFKNKYIAIAHLTLPFYQKDLAFPFSEEKKNIAISSPYQHACGQVPYRFRGMQDVIIYKPHRSIKVINEKY